MTALAHLFAGSGLAFALLGSVGAAPPAAPPAAPASVPIDAAAQAKAAEHDRLMNEVVCRNLDENDTGGRVHHRTCKKRIEWQDYDKRQTSTYDPNTGAVVERH